MKGDIRLLYINDVPVGCLTTNSFDESIDMIDSTGSSNGWVGVRPNLQKYSISFEGYQINTNASFGGDDTKLSYDSLKQIKRDRVKIDWKIDDAFGGLADVGEGYLISLSEQAGSGDEVLTFSGQIVGFGEPENETT